MILGIVWGPQALAALYRMHWQTGAAIDAAVIQFAASVPERPGRKLSRYRLHVAGHDAVLVADREAEVVRIVGLYRVR